MKRHTLFLAFLLSAFTLAGCGNRSTTMSDTTGADAMPASGSSAGGGAASTTGAGGAGGPELFREDAQATLLDELVVYFEYDRSEIQPEFNSMLAAHGQFLASNPGARLRLEGHADERGSREYNIGLGERRAQAVRQVLLLQGATAEQLMTVSYGEERPAVLGSDEEAYSLNRRVELVYRQ